VAALDDGFHFRPFSQDRLPTAVGIAVLLECLLVVSIIWWLVYAHRITPAAIHAPMRLSLVTLPPAPPKPTPPKPVPPKPEPKPKPPPPKPVHHIHHPKPVPKPKPVPTPVVKKTPPPPPPQPVETVAASLDEMAQFEAEVNAAVQAAVRYPPAARMLHRQGRARVAFDYLDGTVSNVLLAESSGFPMLDQAALATVRSARYPPPLAKLRGQRLHMTVWVRFREVDED
jgi:periplasmic protein TonB